MYRIVRQIRQEAILSYIFAAFQAFCFLSSLLIYAEHIRQKLDN